MFISFVLLNSDSKPSGHRFGCFFYKYPVFPVQSYGTSQGSGKVMMMLGEMLRQGENLDHVNHTQDISPTVNLSDVSH